MNPQALHALESRRIVAREAHTNAHRQLRSAGRALGESKDALAKLERVSDVPLTTQNQMARSHGGLVERPELDSKPGPHHAPRATVKEAQRRFDEALAAFNDAEAEYNAVEAEYAAKTREPSLAEMNAYSREVTTGIAGARAAATERLLDALDAAEELES